MAEQQEELSPSVRIRAIMDELGLDWEAAALLYMVESGDAMVDDVVFEWTQEPDSAEAEHQDKVAGGKVPAVPRG